MIFENLPKPSYQLGVRIRMREQVFESGVIGNDVAWSQLYDPLHQLFLINLSLCKSRFGRVRDGFQLFLNVANLREC